MNQSFAQKLIRSDINSTYSKTLALRGFTDFKI